MANYGDFVAKNVVQGSVDVPTTAWTPLQVGSTPQGNRRHVRIFIRGNPGDALALAYANKNAVGGFTTPTDSLKHVTVIPGGRTFIEPLGDSVTLYGRLVNKAASTRNYVRCVVTEYS